MMSYLHIHAVYMIIRKLSYSKVTRVVRTLSNAMKLLEKNPSEIFEKILNAPLRVYAIKKRTTPYSIHELA